MGTTHVRQRLRQRPLPPTHRVRGGRPHVPDRPGVSDRRDSLDDYIEAHVHGPVRLDRDVEALVLDPSYYGTEVEAAGHRLPCRVEWHRGSRLPVADLRRHLDHRGQRYVDLDAALAVDGCLTPNTIGDAARSGHHDEQDLKRVWHYLARFGAPA